VGHWFDGDGAVLALQLTGTEATATYRYVKTMGFLAEQQAGTLQFGGYGSLPAGQWWQRFGKPLKNAANTSVLALPDKLLALWEGGAPHALTLDNLETLGLDELDGLGKLPYSAHPKLDRRTGEIFNFGVSIGLSGILNLYRSDRTGKIQQQTAIALNGIPLIHDFVLAGQYLVFCVPPVRLNSLPVLMQQSSYSEALLWQPDKGTEIIVVDRHTLQVVSRTQTEPWYQWHFANGYQDPDGSVIVQIARYSDFQTNQHLKEVVTGQVQALVQATLWQLWLEPQTGKVRSLTQILDRSCEFPVVNPAETGQLARFIYLAVHRQGTENCGELYNAIARFDTKTETLTEANLGENGYPSEPIYAADAEVGDRGWILTVVYDGNAHRSEVWIFAADGLDREPVCRLALPDVIPLSFHGTWQPG
jgi:carotenoid cleavage dioxygenase-like enzyme